MLVDEEEEEKEEGRGFWLWMKMLSIIMTLMWTDDDMQNGRHTGAFQLILRVLSNSYSVDDDSCETLKLICETRAFTWLKKVCCGRFHHRFYVFKYTSSSRWSLVVVLSCKVFIWNLFYFFFIYLIVFYFLSPPPFCLFYFSIYFFFFLERENIFTWNPLHQIRRETVHSDYWQSQGIAKP